MGKIFTAILDDGTERSVAHFSMDRARLFLEIASLLEHHVGVKSGLSPDDGQDEVQVDPIFFLPFFEAVWNAGWIAEVNGGFLIGWASYAAGIVENISLKRRDWIDRNGMVLNVKRYNRDEES